MKAIILPAVDQPDTGTPVNPRYEYTYDERGDQLTIRDNVYQTAASIFYDHDGTAGDSSGRGHGRGQAVNSE